MNIRTDQVQALLQQQERAAQKAQPATTEGFEAALAQQLGLAKAEHATGLSAPPPGAFAGLVGQVLLQGAEKTSAATDPVAMSVQQAFEQASGALDLWDSYVAALGTPGTQSSLRDAYAFLQGVDSRVAQLKQGAHPALEQNPQLAGIIHELEVMSATEKFKLNRGDYN